MKPAAAYRFVALLVAAAAVLLLAASGPGNRFGLWDYRVALGLYRWAAYAGIAGGALALAGLAVPGIRAGGAGRLAAALVAGIAAFGVPWQFGERAREVPPIHDVTTDPDHPPQFVAVLPLRAGAPNGPGYDGPEAARLQRSAYPDLRPLESEAPPQVVFNRAKDAARSMGWRIVGESAAEGRIEAVATTPWFGFQDDVVIRVTPAGSGSRVDVRSKSRVGRSDLGANARRIREFLVNLRG